MIRRRALLAALGALGLAVALLVWPRSIAAARWVIPPGQEAIALRMLGGDLPAGCHLVSAAIEKTEVVARYACSAGEARLLLRHPDAAPGAAFRSKQLAIVLPEGAAPPPELVSAIAARLGAEEGSWRWIIEGRRLGRSLAAAGLSAGVRRLVVPIGMAAAVRFGAMIVITTRIARRLQERQKAKGKRQKAKGPEDRERGEKGTTVLLALAVMGVVFAYLEVAYRGAPVHSDTTRDLLMAMDCLAGQGCDHGPPTTLGVIVQGALWTRFLAFARAMGLGIAATQAVVLALHAASAAVILVATERRFGRAVAIATAALWAAGSAAVIDVPILWNPSIAPLPLSIFYALLFTLSDDDERGIRSSAASAFLAFVLALSMDAHVLFAVLAPPLFAAIAATARRPLAAVPLAAFALAGTLLLDSRAAWLVNGRALAEAGALGPLAALMVLAVGAGAWARPRVAALEPRARALTFIVVLAVATTGVTALLFAVLGPAAGRRYLIPAVPALALGAALLGARLVERLGPLSPRPPFPRGGGKGVLGLALLAAACAALRLAAPRAAGEGGFSIAEIEAVSREVYRRVPSHREAQARVHARSPAVVAALAIFEPRGAAGSGEGKDEWVLFKRARAGAPPAGPRLVTVDLGAHVAVFAAVAPRLDRSRMTFCFAPKNGVSEEQGCVEARLGREAAGPATPEEHAYPALAAVKDAFPDDVLARFAGGVKQTIRVPVEAGEACLLAIASPRSGYRIEGAGSVARIGPSAGEVVLAREDGGEPRPDRYWPPEVWEAPAGDRVLAEMVEEAGRAP